MSAGYEQNATCACPALVLIPQRKWFVVAKLTLEGGGKYFHAARHLDPLLASSGALWGTQP